MSRSLSDGRDVLRVSDARTEREAGRYDRSAGRLVVADEARVYEVVQALWDFLAGTPDSGTPDSGTPDSGALDSGASDSAAPNGDAGRGGPSDVDEPEQPEAPGIPGGPDIVEACGTPAAAEARGTAGGREKGKGDRLVDRRLGRLRRDGWAVLSPGGGRAGAEFDRLVIGPPGVFAITVTHGGPAPVCPHDDADSAARMLSAASGMVIKVTPMLALIGAGADTVGQADARADRSTPGPAGGVLIARGEDIAEVLWALPAVYSIQERKQISDVARRDGLWRAA